jgi:AcrR family transcriptional regulator
MTTLEPGPEYAPRVPTRGNHRRPLAGAQGLPDICQAAVRLFADQGYGGTRMSDIAAALHVQAPSLYNYVSSKRDLLDLLCLEMMQGSHRALSTGLSLGSDVAEQVRRGMEEQVRFRVRHPYHLQVTARETLHLSAAVRDEVLGLRDLQRAMWLEVVTRGVEEGLFCPASTELAAHLLLEMCSYLQIIHFSLHLKVPESELVYWFGDHALGVVGWAPESMGRPTRPSRLRA